MQTLSKPTKSCEPLGAGAYLMNASHNAQYFFGPDILVAPVTAPSGQAGHSQLNVTVRK